MKREIKTEIHKCVRCGVDIISKRVYFSICNPCMVILEREAKEYGALTK